MKYFICVIMSLPLAACATMPGSKDNLVSNALYGAWEGSLVQFTTKELPDSDNGTDYEVVLLNCGASPEIWLKGREGGYHKVYEHYRVESRAGNHLLSLIVVGPGWVETQTWTLVSINTSKAALQWNRMVSNPYLEDDNQFRSFGQMGFGELGKISNHCDIWDAETQPEPEQDLPAGILRL